MTTLSLSKLNIQKFLSILIYLLPLALVTGPFLSDLIVSIVALYILIVFIKRKEFNEFKRIFFIAFLIFYFYILFRSLLSTNIILSLESSLFYFRYLLFIIGFIYLSRKVKNFHRNLFNGLQFVIILLVVDGYFQFFIGHNLIGIERNISHISSFFGEDYKLGRYLAHIFPIYLGLFLLIKKMDKRDMLTLFTSFILIDTLVFISGERSAFLLMTISSLVIILCINKYKLLRLIALMCSVLIIVIFSLSSETIKNRMVDTTFAQMEHTAETGEIISNSYSNIYSNSIALFIENPLFGQGPKLFREKCMANITKFVDGCSTHPHNTYLQLLSETGIIGTLFISSFFLYISARLFKQFINNFFFERSYYLSDFEVCMYTSILLALWPFATNLNFFNNWISILYFLPIGLLLTKSNFNKI